MTDNSTAAATGPKVDSSKRVQANPDSPEPVKENTANTKQNVGDRGEYPSPSDQISEPNAGMRTGNVQKAIEDLQKSIADLTKFVSDSAQRAPQPSQMQKSNEDSLTKEEEELVKVLEDYFEGLEKRLEARVEERLAKYDEGLKKAGLVPVSKTPSAPVPNTERTPAYDDSMRKEEEQLTKADEDDVPSYDDLAKEVASGKGLKWRL